MSQSETVISDIPLNNEQTGFSAYMRLIRYLKGDLRYLGVAFIGFAIFAACDSAFAWWMKQLVDAISAQESDARLYLSVLIIIIFSIRGISAVIGNYATEFVARNVVNKIRQQLFDHVLELPCNYYDETSTGGFLSKLVYNIENVANASTNALRIVVRGGLTVVFLLAYMVYVNWQLSLIFLVVTPLMGAIIFFITKKIRNISHRIQQEIGKVGSRAGEVIKGHRIVKIYSGTKQEKVSFAEIIENDRKHRISLSLTNSMSVSLVQILFALALSALIILAMSPSILDTMSTGDFISFITAAGFISRPLQQLTQVNSVIQQGIAAAQSVFMILDLPVESAQGQQKPINIEGNIQFENVSFSYKDSTQSALNNVSLDLEAGKTYAIVGLSGSGKSTLVSLLPQFYLATSGKILIDGVDTRSMDLAYLRQQIALVNQDTVLFNDTIYNNIAYGELRKAPYESVERAAQHAQVLEFAHKLEKGLQTMIGESGSNLSGGQKQRISIARAFLKDAPILILDEATSALDSKSEELIQQSLKELRQNRTCLIIAHRLSTIESADEIFVMDNGCIIEKGDHHELLAKKGVYAEFYQRQFES